MKPGYKKTEVGVIPDGWEVTRLGEIATIATGNTPPTNDASNYGDEFLFVGPVDMGENKFITRSEKGLSKKGFAMSRRFPKDSILFVSIGSTIGKCGIAPVELTSNQQINAVFPSPSFSADYLFYAISTAAPRIKAQAGEQAVPIVNKTQFSETAVALPPLPEQHAIAEVLSDVDGLLGGLDRLIGKKRDLKQAAMQQLLTGQTRLPGFHGEWDTKTLKQIVKTPITDGPHSTPRFLDDGIPFLSVNNLVDGKVDLRELRFVSREDHELFSRKCKPQKDDILLGKAASVGKVAIVDFDFEFNIWSPIALIRVSHEHTPRFVYYQLQGAAVSKQITLLTNSSSQGNIGMGDIEKLIVSLPERVEQTAIAEVLTEMDLELAGLEQRREKTSALKQAMMQELLTGKTRLVSTAQAHD